jgi:hypothetical protein
MSKSNRKTKNNRSNRLRRVTRLEPLDCNTRLLSLPGALTITHLLLFLGLIAACSLLADSSGVIVFDDSNRAAFDILQWLDFLIVCPLIPLVLSRDSGTVWAIVIAIVANSLLIGYGLAGAIRMIARCQFSLRSLFVLMTLVALCFFAITSQKSVTSQLAVCKNLH